MDSQTTCPYCQGSISSADYFCPSCGKKLKEKPLATTFGKQLMIYLISVFLPPLGILPAIKYLRQPDAKSKKIGLVTLVLTIISVIVTTWLTIGLVNSLSKGMSDQLNLYQNLGY